MNRVFNTRHAACTFMLVFSWITCSSPVDTRAQYKRREDPLPGMISTETLVITAVVSLAVIVTVAIAVNKVRGDDDDETPAPVDSTEFDLVRHYDASSMHDSLIITGSQISTSSHRQGNNFPGKSFGIPVEPVIAYKRDEIRIGVRYSF